MKLRFIVMTLLAAALAACGGGGGGGGGGVASVASDVSVSVVGPGDPVPSGSTATFNVTVSNAGPDTARSVAVNSTPAGGLTLGAVTCTAAGGAVCPATLGATMNVTGLPAGGSLSFTLPATVASATSGALNATVSIAASDDPGSANNTHVATINAYTANVEVAGSAPAAAVPSGGVATYTMSVRNVGPDAARDVTIANTVDANQTLGAVSCAASGGATCPASLGTTMNVPALPKDGVLTFTVPATVTAGTNGSIANSLSATAAGDPQSGNNAATATGSAYSANVSISNSGSVKVHAGNTATFSATLANAGPSAAQNLTIDHTLTAGYSAGTIGCTAAGGASCPAATGATMTVPALPVGGSLSFSIPVPVAAAARGAITSTLQVTSAGDPVGANNTASATTIAEDPRNDSYKAYATDGRLYTLSVDFDARTYTMAGNGLNASGALTADGSATTFTFAGNAKFRVAEDLLVGGFDFGAGVKSFVAARRFVTTMSELNGTFNTFGLNLPTGAAVDSRIFTSRFENGVLHACLDNIIYKNSLCPAASVWSYALTLNGDEVTGFDATHNDTITFRVAKSGSTLIYLRAGAAGDGSGRRFRIALPERSGLAGGTFSGASTNGAWGTATLTATTYNVTGTSAGGSPISDSATLSGLGANSPEGIRGGNRASDSAFIFVMQFNPIGALIGARNGPAAGYIEIGVP